MKFYLFLTVVLLCIILPLVYMNKTHLGNCKKKAYNTSASFYKFITNGLQLTLNSKYYFIPNLNLYKVKPDLILNFKNKKNNNYVFVNCSDYVYCLNLKRKYYDGRPDLITKFQINQNSLSTDFLGNVPYPGVVNDSYFVLNVEQGVCA